MKTTYLALFLSCTWVGQTLHAQGFSEYTWKSEMAKCPEIPEAFKTADAIIVKSETYSKSSFSGEYPYIDQLATYRTQSHTKILTEKALEDYKRIAIPKYKGQIGEYVQIKEYDVRIRRAGGSINDLVIKSLPKSNIPEDDEMYDSRDDYYFYDLPSVAVGDEIETVSIIESKFPDQGRLVNLYQEYPVLETIFTLSVPNVAGLKGEIYNGMPKPATRTSGDQRIFSWTMKNLKAVPEANSSGTIFANDLEYFIYEIDLSKFMGREVTAQNYKELALEAAGEFVKVRNPNKKKMEEFYTTLFAGKANTSLEKALALTEYIAKKLKMVGRLEENERSNSLDYFLTNNKANYQTLMCIYRDFFERFNIKYYLAFGKSRYDGKFDINFVSNTQISDYFFVFENESEVDGKKRTDFYWLSGTNGINEADPSLLGTTVFLVNPLDRAAEMLSIDFPDTEIKNLTDNKRLRRLQVEVKLNENIVNVKSDITYTGLYSTYRRGGMIAANKADTLVKAIQRNYNSLFKDFNPNVTAAQIKQFDVLPPYPFRADFAVSLTGYVKQKDSKYIFDLKNWIENNVRNVVNPENRILDYHPVFVGNDVDDIYFAFDKEVTIDNLADFNQKIDNEYASYICKVTQINPKTIRLESRYTVKQDFIPKDKAKLLDEANQAVEKISKLKLIITPK